jgi:hypothetical protein
MEEEQKDLFQAYFDGFAVFCPVCAEEVSLIMNHMGEVVTLLARCDGCGNRALLLFGGLIALPAQKVSREPQGF